MLPRLRLLIPVVLILLSVSGPAQASPQAPLAAGVTLQSPLACPVEGCAAGQRLNLTLEFDLSTINANVDPNIQVCLYTANNLATNSITFTPTGGLSSAVYQLDTQSAVDCGDTPPEYTFQLRASSHLPQGTPADFLGFAIRIGPAAIHDGAILARVFENTGTAWTKSLETNKLIPVAPLSSTVYVANDASACNNNVPCFVNSGDDLPDGVGTGLKDAVDAVSTDSTVTILGAYNIKGNTVVIPQRLSLKGSNNASLTYSGGSCVNPMLDIRAGITLSQLSMNSGSCSSPARDLIFVNSDQDVTIESNDLTGGNDAIHIGNSTGNVLVRFNQVENNSGYAVIVDSGPTGAGQISAVANNLFGNRPGPQVECQSRGQVDHNYWGAGNLPSTASSNCTVSDARRLGAAIHHKSTTPGVDATQVSVTDTKTYAFGDQIGFQRSSSGPDLGLYLVNHGFEGNASIPFMGSGVEALSPCSNFWDVFLKNGEKPASDEVLSLYFKYNLSSGCIATVESTNYCANT
ncbi:MAG: hypothetical protein PHQ40_21915, partial [Anaerolineaceae bacterium]|nr:hypothetical protein [Anaerolineaceae bacterium]